MASKPQAAVRWEDDGMYFDCPDCGGETHFAKLADNVRCSHCGAIYELPPKLPVTKVAHNDQRGRAIADGC